MAEEKEAAKPAAPAPANVELDLSKKLDGKDGIDFVCEADIYYSWKRKSSGKENAAPKAEKEIDVFYTTVGERGLVGLDVRNRLTSKIPKIKMEALVHCRKSHQDQAKCVASQLRSNAQDYNMMDFKSRSAFLTALQNDCAENTGECVGTKTRPIKCYLNRPPNSPLAEEKTEEEGKDEKKKKKKKK